MDNYEVSVMEFRTAISKMTTNDMIIRGRKQSEMIRSWSFPKSIFFLLSGREPDEREEELFNAMLTAILDHGMGTASALTTRFVQSTGNTLNTAVGAGILALGEYHGGAIEKAMHLFAEVRGQDLAAFIKQALAEKRLLYGYGHKVYKEFDPRTRMLRERCRELSFSAPTFDLALRLEEELARQKPFVLNIDGALAALLLDLGFPPRLGKGFFIIGRVPGLVAHAIEEREREKPVRRLAEDEIRYDGPWL